MKDQETRGVDREQLARRFAEQRARLERAAHGAGRDPASVRLLAVSKTQPPEALRAAYELGQRDFGENYVQELLAKAKTLADLPELRFHLIGHLQRNKARLVAGHVHVVQTVDSERLAQELGQRAASAERADRLPVLVEVNIGGEPEKSGCAPDELGPLLDAIEQQPALQLRGLMTVPPATEEAEGARPFFEELRRLRDRHGGVERLPELSMGMSHDADVAVAAGATWVRIGTALFGPRRPKEP